jgi:hypothetical protein
MHSRESTKTSNESTTGSSLEPLLSTLSISQKHSTVDVETFNVESSCSSANQVNRYEPNHDASIKHVVSNVQAVRSTGRVPATKRDPRKLFVGGLPADSKCYALA